MLHSVMIISYCVALCMLYSLVISVKDGAVGDCSHCLDTLAIVVTLLCATVPLMKVASNENEAPCSAWRLAQVLDKR